MQSSLRQDASDRRSETRQTLTLAASLYCDGSSSPVKIRNISSTGALVESRGALATGTLVQLVRGPLIIHALVTWSENGRCGLKFSGSIDVRQWRATPINTEQQRVDELVKLVKAGAVPLPVNEASEDLPDGADGLSADLRRALELLENLGDRLAKDAIVVALYPAELQNLDIAMQVIAAVGSIVSGESGVATGARKFGSLRISADQALGRAAAA